GAWLRPPRRRNGGGCPKTGPCPRPRAGGTPRGPGRWPGGSGPASRWPTSGPPAGATPRKRAAGAARRRGDRLARWPTRFVSRHSWVPPTLPIPGVAPGPAAETRGDYTLHLASSPELRRHAALHPAVR